MYTKPCDNFGNTSTVTYFEMADAICQGPILQCMECCTLVSEVVVGGNETVMNKGTAFTYSVKCTNQLHLYRKMKLTGTFCGDRCYEEVLLSYMLSSSHTSLYVIV